MYFDNLNEKQRIELTTAEGFLRLLNAKQNSSFRITNLGDSPDIKCTDDKGDELNVEITLAQDADKDIQAFLGRSDHLGLDALKKELEQVELGKRKLGPIKSNEIALERMILTIKAKLTMQYGANTALVVRDTSPLDWEWDVLLPRIRELLQKYAQPFDRGIWIVDKQKTTLYKVF